MKVLLSNFLFALVFLLLATSASALPPSDAEIVQEIKESGALSVKLGPKQGHKQWNADYGTWEYVRGVEVIRDYPKKEGVTIKILGDMVYQIYGSDYKYWKFRTISNEYLGMGVPTSEEILKLIRTDMPKFVSSYWYNKIIGDIKSFYIADEPKFTWHTPNSLSLNMVAEYRAKVSNIELQDIVQTYNIRLYRDAEDKPWKNFISTAKERNTSNSKKYTYQEVREMKTLGDVMREKQAQAAVSKLPSIDVPDFKDGMELAMAVNKAFKTGTPESVEAFLIQTLAPQHFVKGSTVQLNPRSAQMIKQNIDKAFKGKGKYAQQYCMKPEIDKKRSSKKRIYYQSIGNRIASQVAFDRFGGGYVDGVKQPGEYKITSLAIWTKQSADDLAFFGSFSSPQKACPQDHSSNS
jgi:hypothetical protein